MSQVGAGRGSGDDAVYDLRSDTVTQPTDAMRRAMAQAEVGDDVYGEDPTLIELEARAATLLGMEAGLFLPSGTMGNLCALLAHCRPGTSALVDSESHIAYYEAGGMARLAGVMPRYFPRRGYAPTPAELDDLLPPAEDIHIAPASLVSLENTHTRRGGIPFSVTETEAVIKWAKRRGLAVHIDGARLFNAAIALGCSPVDLVRGADSVMISLSKGLSAPVGSVLVGEAGFIAEARRMRKLLGGGMRHAGVLGAAGLLALERIPHLEEDHQVAAQLAERLADLPGIQVREAPIRTNMVMIDLPAPDGASPGGAAPDRVGSDGAGSAGQSSATGEARGPERPADQLADALRRHGVLVNALGPRFIRLVTHRHISEAAIDPIVHRFALAIRAMGEANAPGN